MKPRNAIAGHMTHPSLKSSLCSQEGKSYKGVYFVFYSVKPQ